MSYKAAAVSFLFKRSSFFPLALTAAHRGLSDGCGFPLVYLLYTDAWSWLLLLISDIKIRQN